MSRCKCCEAVLTTYDMSLTKEDGTFEDLCGQCRWFAYNDEILETRTYAFEDITERLVDYTFKDKDEND